MSGNYYTSEFASIPYYFFGINVNTPKLDGVACSECGKIPEPEFRIDCDASKGTEPEKLETYCEKCYWNLANPNED